MVTFGSPSGEFTVSFGPYSAIANVEPTVHASYALVENRRSEALAYLLMRVIVPAAEGEARIEPPVDDRHLVGDVTIAFSKVQRGDALTAEVRVDARDVRFVFRKR